MKKILGLDLGTTSIGWAYVHEAENDQELSSIIDVGVRVNPLTTDEQNDFLKGKPITTNAERRLKRGMRRNLQRYKLRRSQLIDLLLQNGIISKESVLHEEGKGTTFETLHLRSLAATEQIELEQFARVLLSINRKRGYRSSRKIVSSDDGVVIDGMKLARELYNQNLTPGQWLYQQITAEKLKGIPDFYRSDLVRELELIWRQQSAYYPEILTENLYNNIQGKGGNDTAKILSQHSKVEIPLNKGKRSEVFQRILSWRSLAITKQIAIEELWAVVVDLNKAIAKSSGYLGNISDRSKTLFFNKQTVGQYLYSQILRDKHCSLRNQIFYGQDYLDEFERIWETQKQFYPQLSDELKAEIRDVVIFYQRRLRSQKGLINFCELESREKEIIIPDSSGREIKEKTIIKKVGPRVVPRSSPLFQEFKIWQMLGNILIYSKGSRKCKDGGANLSLEEKQKLFQELNVKGRLKADQALKILHYSTQEWEMNYKELNGNSTNASLYKVYLQIAELEGCDIEKSLGIKKENWAVNDIDKPANSIIELIQSHFEMLEIDVSLLNFDALLKGKDFLQQSSYSLWHLLYSYEGDNSITGNETLCHLLEKKYGFAPEHSRLLANVTFVQGYGNLSAKALKAILPYMPEHTYSEACVLAGYKHSRSSLTKEEIAQRLLADKLPLLPKGSLRQPIVEKILNQLVNLVNTLIDKYSLRDENGNVVEVFHFDEIRIELARELKKNAKEREELTKKISESEIRNKKIVDVLKDEFGIFNPSRSDIIRYRLYQELEGNGYKDLYRNRYISKELLFSSEIDIEHIIPQSRLFDDSFSNKTLAYRSDNLKKANRTAIDYISQDYATELDSYTARIEDLKARKVISPAKAQKLLKRASEIGDGFIERDLRTTQYISKKSQEILLGVTRSVVATSGQITDRLRRDWGLINVMKEINIDKYRALGLTEQIQRRNQTTIEVIKDWTKRNDHRHHAMDALTVAFTKRSHIQYLNHLNARYIKDDAEKHLEVMSVQQTETEYKPDNCGQKKHLFKLPMPNFRSEAKEHLEKILVSHKTKNKVVTRNRSQGGKQICLTPRGELHKEKIYAKRKWLNEKPRPLNKKFTLEQVDLIANPKIRSVVKEHIAHYPSIEVALDGKTLKKDPILYKGESLCEVVCYDEIFTIREPITPEIKIEKVLDRRAREVLGDRLREYDGNAKLAFSDLETKPIWLDKHQGICLKSVTIKARPTSLEALRSKRTAEGDLCYDKQGKTIPVDYVLNSSNHHIAIYRDSQGVLQEYVVSFMEAVARVNVGLQIINKDYNKDLGWEFLFTLKQNEMFVFPNPDTGFDPHEIDLLDPRNKAAISPNLYRVQKLSSRDYVFRHHLETSVESDIKDLTFKRIQTTNGLKDCIKVRINHLGDIVQVGEY